MNIDAYGPVGLWIAEHNMVDPLKARMEMVMNKGLQIIIPHFVMPQFELEPFTQDELREIYGYKRKANTLKLRSIIRKAKQNETRS